MVRPVPAGRRGSCCTPYSRLQEEIDNVETIAVTANNTANNASQLAQQALTRDTFDDVNVNGDLNVYGDIIQQGAAYETHAQHVFSTDDYIVMRDGALVGLAVGDYSGFQVKKYDGTNDGRLVMDKDGVARVGDVGDEQPLLTRDEASLMSNGHLLAWDGANDKAVTYNGDLCRLYTGYKTFSASVWRSDVTAPPDFPYSAELQVSADLNGGDNEYPVVTFSPYNTENTLFAPFCDVYGAQGDTPGGLKVYASALPTTQTALTYVIMKKVTH